MTEDKKIEEMAKDICLSYGNGVCRQCYDYEDCTVRKEAERLYNSDFRKASDVAREMVAEIEEGVKAAISALQFENNPIHRKVKHETYSSLMRFIKIVEKKYTEEMG